MAARMILMSVSFVVISLAFVLADEKTAARAFEPYEAVRVALAGDRMDGVSRHAAALAPLAEELAGTEGRAAAERLADAADLREAREAFAAVSRLLVPTFQDAALAAVQVFECAMVHQIWAQRGEKPQNPYMGQAMAGCGTRVESKQ